MFYNIFVFLIFIRLIKNHLSFSYIESNRFIATFFRELITKSRVKYFKFQFLIIDLIAAYFTKILGNLTSNVRRKFVTFFTSTYD